MTRPDLCCSLAREPAETLGAIQRLHPVGAMLVLTAVLACGGPPVCCEPSMGLLRATTVTTGVNIGPAGYTLVLTQIAGQDSLTVAVGVNATISIPLIPATPLVRLQSVPSNCVVAGDNPRSVTIVTNDTASTTFNVSCS